MSEWSYIWEIERKNAGIVDIEWFWEPILSLGRVVAYRWRKMVLTEPQPWVSKEMPSWGGAGSCIGGHPVFGRVVPGTLFIQGERYPTEVC